MGYTENQIYGPFNQNIKRNYSRFLRDKLTVITTTSYIKSHPSTKMLEITQKSLFINPEFWSCKKIIVFDGLRARDLNDPVHQEKYNEYKKQVIKLCQLNPFFSNTQLIFLDENKTLSGAIQKALAYVDTPYIFLHQHDLKHIHPVLVEKIIASMEKNPNLKHVRIPTNTTTQIIGTVLLIHT